MCIKITYIYTSCDHEHRSRPQHCYRYYGPDAVCRLHHRRENVPGHCHECKRKIAIHNALQEKARAREREEEREREREAERKEFEKRAKARERGRGSGSWR